MLDRIVTALARIKYSAIDQLIEEQVELEVKCGRLDNDDESRRLSYANHFNQVFDKRYLSIAIYLSTKEFETKFQTA